MADVQLTIGGRTYSVACRDGGEDHLRKLGAQVDKKAADASRAVGNATEARTLLLAALLLADELGEVRAGTAPAPETGLSPAVAEALAKLAERVESLADSLETAVTKA
jgi:cell division protein ZapA